MGDLVAALKGLGDGPGWVVAAVALMGFLAFWRERKRKLSADATKTEAEAVKVKAEAKEIDSKSDHDLTSHLYLGWKAFSEALNARLLQVEARADKAISQEAECQRQLAEIRERLHRVESVQRERLNATPGLILLGLLGGSLLALVVSL